MKLRLALSLLVWCATRASAQALPAYRHRILGVFDNEGKPLEGVEVTDVKSGTTALTTVTGTVTLAYLPDGGSEVRVRQIGYVSVTQFIRIGPADTVPVTVILLPSSVVLAPVITRDTNHAISPGLRDFEERRHMGRGYFIGEKELRKSDSRDMPNVLRTVPGLMINCSKNATACYAVSPRGSLHAIAGGPCLFNLYIDGIRVSELNLYRYSVNEFAAIESYVGAQIPAQYNGVGSGCGVLLLWSRER
jgi:hypothetical protein